MFGSPIQPATDSSITEAARFLAAGELVGIPTETVYGLAADATNPAAVEKIFRVKGRPSNNPLIIHVASVDAAMEWIEVDQPPWLAEQWRRAAAFWPGPLTVVVPHGGKVIDEVTAAAPTVAVRIPDHPVMQKLLAACPFPIAAPSANRSNYVSPTRAEHVADALGDQVAMVLDGGACGWGVESTIIRPGESGVELLRPGGITPEQLQATFGSLRLPSSDSAATKASSSAPSRPMPAPGMLARHYSPSKPLVTVGDSRAETFDPAELARIAFAPLTPSEAERFGWYRCLSPQGDLREVAQNLFAAMRDADASMCRWIVIDRCERTGIGQAIMDRIDRACG